MLGLPEAVSGQTYQATATTVAATEVIWVSREDLLRQMQADAQLRLLVVELLSRHVHGLYGKVRDLHSS